MISSVSQLNLALKEKANEYGLRFDVGGAGLLQCEVAIISTSPGPTELKTGIPLSGGAGHILWSTIRPHGFTRNDVYVTNVLKRPTSSEVDDADGRGDNRSATVAEFSAYTQLLKWELSQLPNLRYILLLGNEALEALTGHSGILKCRGSIYEASINGRTVPAFATVNPALVARYHRILNGTASGTVPLRSLQKVFEFDLHKFKLLTQGKLSKYVITHNINPSYEQACEYIRMCARQPDAVATDIETFNNETSCIGLAHSHTEGMCINFINPDLSSRYTLEQEHSIRHELSILFTSHGRIVAQNGLFDATWLWFKDRIKLNVWFDTLLAHHALWPGLPHNLGFLTSRYTTHPYYKDDKDDWKTLGDIDAYWRYNVTDCCITLACQDGLLRELQKANMTAFFFDHVMRLQPHLARMVVGGVKVDLEYKEHVRETMERQLAQQLLDFRNAVQTATGEDGYQPNPSSIKDMGELLFRRLKLIGKGTKVDKLNRERMLNHPRTSDEAKAVLITADKYVKSRKFYSTYICAETDPDGRMRCEYKQYGTTQAPGRLSSSQTGWRTGTNLQNQPHAAYPMFVADHGYGFFYFDLEQAEARYVGWYAKIKSWVEDFERARLTGDYDCHRALAATMWNIPYDEVPKKDVDPVTGLHTLRYTAKRCRHGLNYRMQAPRLAEVTKLPFQAALEAFRLYHKITPELRKWWTATEEEAKTKKILYNAYGRRWMLTEPVTEQTLESIVAYRPQSTIGDKVNRVIYMAESDPRWPSDSRIVMNLHDALIGIGPHDKLDRCLAILKQYAEEPVIVRSDMPPMIIPAGCKRTREGTKWRIKDDVIEFYSDNAGYHRWSHLEAGEMPELLDEFMVAA